MSTKRKITVPSLGTRARKRRKVTRKRAHTPVRLQITIDPSLQHQRPTLLFKRHYPSLTYVVPPVKVPFYWFDRRMVEKKLILSVPPDTFVVDGRRFKVLMQDYHYVGRFGYTRWLVFEEAAVGKGNKP